ncbi:MAG: hypothetical protein F6K40_23025, partial [Okeania sp. SIO3I5]|uniref:hypothetical protein n=1 Tax=Okeania sp. SIO3I5 TaxID=2607805 RepID=UPI0013B75CE1|nr:hypothetical protein [Okeania sp. SIO3I5]
MVQLNIVRVWRPETKLLGFGDQTPTKQKKINERSLFRLANNLVIIIFGFKEHLKMAYSDFKTINQAQATFDLSINMVNLFPNIELVEPSEYLKMTLKRNLKVAFDNNTE